MGSIVSKGLEQQAKCNLLLSLLESVGKSEGVILPSRARTIPDESSQQAAKLIRLGNSLDRLGSAWIWSARRSAAQVHPSKALVSLVLVRLQARWVAI